jgi:hypothetical protein
MRTIAAALAGLMMCAAAAAAAEEEPLTVGVAEFEVKNEIGLENAGVVIPELLVGKLKEAGTYDLSERILLQKALEEQQLQMSGLTDEETASEVGEIYNIEAVVSGSAMQVGRTIRINGRLIHTETGEIIEAATVKFGDINRLEERMRALAYRLSGWTAGEYERMALKERMSRSRYGVRLGTAYQFNSSDTDPNGVYAPLSVGFFYHSLSFDAELAGNIPHITSSSSHITLSAFYAPFLHVGFGFTGSYMYDGIASESGPSATYYSLMAGIDYRANEALRAQLCIGPTIAGKIDGNDFEMYWGDLGLANAIFALEYGISEEFSLQLSYLMQSGETVGEPPVGELYLSSTYLTLMGSYSFSIR